MFVIIPPTCRETSSRESCLNAVLRSTLNKQLIYWNVYYIYNRNICCDVRSYHQQGYRPRDALSETLPASYLYLHGRPACTARAERRPIFAWFSIIQQYMAKLYSIAKVEEHPATSPKKTVLRSNLSRSVGRMKQQLGGGLLLSEGL